MAKNPHDHVAPHLVWTYLRANSELSKAEHDHIMECDQCLRLVMLCLKSETFGAVLKQLDEELDERRSA
jgi:hypothetical protein